jgi:hypothetical protein
MHMLSKPYALVVRCRSIQKLLQSYGKILSS